MIGLDNHYSQLVYNINSVGSVKTLKYSVTCKLVAAYIITKLSVDSILDNNYKMPMDCGSKF